VVIRFLAPVCATSVNALLAAVDQQLSAGAKQLTLLISSMGGDSSYGIAAYNFLKGIPLEIVTHNFGSVDSIGVVLFCAGTRRRSVPYARFTLHSGSVVFEQALQMDEPELDEQIKTLRVEMANVAGIVAETTGRPVAEVMAAMQRCTVLTAPEAQAWGLVHDISSTLLEPGSTLISITEDADHATK
jgi:ATP-dependent protease ClpP protease subunit